MYPILLHLKKSDLAFIRSLTLINVIIAIDNSITYTYPIMPWTPVVRNQLHPIKNFLALYN